MKRLGLNLILTALFLPLGATAAPEQNIRLGSVGYLPERAKIATVIGATGSEFVVKRADGTEVLQSELGRFYPVTDSTLDAVEWRPR